MKMWSNRVYFESHHPCGHFDTKIEVVTMKNVSARFFSTSWTRTVIQSTESLLCGIYIESSWQRIFPWQHLQYSHWSAGFCRVLVSMSGSESALLFYQSLVAKSASYQSLNWIWGKKCIFTRCSRSWVLVVKWRNFYCLMSSQYNLVCTSV